MPEPGGAKVMLKADLTIVPETVKAEGGKWISSGKGVIQVKEADGPCAPLSSLEIPYCDASDQADADAKVMAALQKSADAYAGMMVNLKLL